ncbi:ribbon-helix-helix domain-containing protein [Shewanella inventionis]|uniref:CopG family transcriptional regulator n=1 Tax=Shewanella inventionis TaxID=1738770 RepID=A0ABQ1IUG5_9GAMM|nr:CopG family transcriptional regulator [Shewanella inventionis]MCL1156653.1 ribbon-helix-helix domain-containing protein [Shewanella inventionis]UAL44868.1 ribbon-helix-helix domain-containing protein [Shewanella inventionis]GGB50696.1 CopG family transcriptional regulator [Shewanella inventionis]
MGLADLKKNASLCKSDRPIAITVDDFIAAADLYAAGLNTRSSDCINAIAKPTNVVDFLQRKYQQHNTMTQTSPVPKKPYKRCTFTLSETAIEQLTTLSQTGQVAKSKLIRQLIAHYFSLTPEQQKRIDANFND